VPEVRREHAVADQLLNVADALVTRALELSESETRRPIGDKNCSAPRRASQHTGDTSETISAIMRGDRP
jgi:hypothetical protein